MRLTLIPKANRGFTLNELMVVIAIIGILSGIAIPSYMRYRNRGHIAHATGDLKKIQRAVQDLGHDTGRWPTGKIAGEGLAFGSGDEIWDLSASALVVNPGPPFTGWQGPYLDDTFVDPWGTPYFMDEDYRIGGGRVATVVGSLGPDQCCNFGAQMYDDNNIFVIIPSK